MVPGIGGVGRGGNGESLFNGCEVSFGDDENVFGNNRDDAFTTL